MSRSLLFTIAALLTFGITAAAFAQANIASNRSESMPSLPSPTRHNPSPVRAASPAPAIFAHITGGPGVILFHNNAETSGSAAAPGYDATVESGDARVTEEALYYNGLVPAQLFEHYSSSQQEDFGSMALSLHIPNVRSSVSMGGGDVALNGGMISMARSAGLAEGNLEVATLDGRFGVRVQGRAMYYRSPLMSTPWLSTANWVVTERPSFSAYYHF